MFGIRELTSLPRSCTHKVRVLFGSLSPKQTNVALGGKLQVGTTHFPVCFCPSPQNGILGKFWLLWLGILIRVQEFYCLWISNGVLSCPYFIFSD